MMLPEGIGVHTHFPLLKYSALAAGWVTHTRNTDSPKR